MVDVIESTAVLRTRVAALRASGKRIGFVPTMGFLHEGHVSLLRAARDACDIVVLSIYVNPAQFGPKEDLGRYPRDLPADLLKANAAGVDIAFVPENLYAPGHATSVVVTGVSEGLCGASRPGHFAGVATVVAKLFHLVAPHVAYFGQKDYQQLAVIRQMAADLDFDLEIVGLPTVREADGLALSSRNSYLDAAQRRSALALSQALNAAQAAFEIGERGADQLVLAACNVLLADNGVRTDYVEVRDALTLSPIARVTRPIVLALAAFVGTTRLIDNRVLDPALFHSNRMPT